MVGFSRVCKGAKLLPCSERTIPHGDILVTGRLPWQPDGIKFTQHVTGQKSAFSPL